MLGVVAKTVVAKILATLAVNIAASLVLSLTHSSAFYPNATVRTPFKWLLFEVLLELDVIHSDCVLNFSLFAVHTLVPSISAFETAFFSTHWTAEMELLFFSSVEHYELAAWSRANRYLLRMGLDVLVQTELIEVSLLVGCEKHQHIIRCHLLFTIRCRTFYGELALLNSHLHMHSDALHVKHMVASFHREELAAHFSEANATYGKGGQFLSLSPFGLGWGGFSLSRTVDWNW